MKRIVLSLFAAAGLAVTAARADHVDVRGSINLGGPAYYGQGYGAPNGYWRDVSYNEWIPGHWEVRRNYWGRAFNAWEPGHYEVRTRREWVNGYADGRNREHWEHERWEHERREHGYDRDDRDDRWHR